MAAILLSACGGEDTSHDSPLTAAGAGAGATSGSAGSAGAATSAAGSGRSSAGTTATMPPSGGATGSAGRSSSMRGAAGQRVSEAGATGSMAGGSAGAAGASAGASAAGRSGAAGAAGATAAAGATGAAGGASTGGYSPCPMAEPCKILPLGDSITEGLGFSGGYRVHLFELAVMNMKKITFVGSRSNGPMTVSGMPFPKKHEGTSGITIGGLDGKIPMPGLNEIPHIILLHIGTNDMYMTPAGAPDRLGTLLDGIIMGAPDAFIVVAKIIPLSSGASAVKTYNDAIPAVVQKRIDAGKHVVLIDQFEGFPTSELGDGVHPNQQGYSRMAEKWYGAISKYLH